MTKEELAEKLTGREYGNEITEDEESAAGAAGLVVVFGASDDLMEFRGAISDEAGAYDGTTILFTKDGLFEECDAICSHSQLAARQAKRITAVWAPEGEPYSWIIKTEIPHATFEIVEDGQPFCRGIVFELNAAAENSGHESVTPTRVANV